MSEWSKIPPQLPDWLPPERVTLEWRRACYREAREIVSVWHIRQQLTRRKRRRNW